MEEEINTEEVPTLSNQSIVTSLPNYIEDFLRSIDIRENSKGTYQRALRQFFTFLCDKTIYDLIDNDILYYKNHLKELGLSAYTITSYLVVVRRFFAWTESKKIYPNIARSIKGMKAPKGFRKECLTGEQTNDLLTQFGLDTLQAKRDFAIINILLRTGLRTIELQRANIGDISQTGGEAKLFIQGKGRDSKDDFVILTQASLKPLRDYLRYRPNTSDNEPLFTSVSDRNNGKRIGTRSLSRIVKNALISAGLDNKKLSAHSLRHTAITSALIAGASLQEVKGMARHTNINTTLVYSHNIDRVTNAPERKIDEYLRGYLSILSNCI